MSSFYIYQHNPCERVAYLVVYALIQKKVEVNLKNLLRNELQY